MFKKLYKTFIVARTMSVLSQMTDRQLEDIGISRGDIAKHAESLYV